MVRKRTAKHAEKTVVATATAHPDAEAVVAALGDAFDEFLDDDRRWIPNRAEDRLVDLHETGAMSGGDGPSAVADLIESR